MAWRHRNDSAVSAVTVPGGGADDGQLNLPGGGMPSYPVVGRRDYFV
jgi:hypothetical protein